MRGGTMNSKPIISLISAQINFVFLLQIMLQWARLAYITVKAFPRHVNTWTKSMYIWSSCLLNDHTMTFLTSVRECLLSPTSVKQHQNKFLDVASCHGLKSVLVYLLATVTNTWENQFKVIKRYFGSLLQRFPSKPIHCLRGNHMRSSCSPSVIRKQERQDTSNPTPDTCFLHPSSPPEVSRTAHRKKKQTLSMWSCGEYGNVQTITIPLSG